MAPATGRNNDAERARARLQIRDVSAFRCGDRRRRHRAIGAAYHLKAQCPGLSFIILEAQDSFGGTWITHRYPGIRSDSDLYTFGYRFKPWLGKPIATADEILAYLGEIIDENGLAAHIRYRHRIARANWSSGDNLWALEGSRETDRASRSLHSKFSLDVPGILPACERLHARMGRHGEFRRSDRSRAIVAG